MHPPPLPQDAACHLRTREYVHLRPRQRLALLHTLVELALQAEVMRDYISSRCVCVCVGGGHD